jgi:hypothetical protein
MKCKSGSISSAEKNDLAAAHPRQTVEANTQHWFVTAGLVTLTMALHVLAKRDHRDSRFARPGDDKKAERLCRYRDAVPGDVTIAPFWNARARWSVAERDAKGGRFVKTI